MNTFSEIWDVKLLANDNLEATTALINYHVIFKPVPDGERSAPLKDFCAKRRDFLANEMGKLNIGCKIQSRSEKSFWIGREFNEIIS